MVAPLPQAGPAAPGPATAPPVAPLIGPVQTAHALGDYPSAYAPSAAAAGFAAPRPRRQSGLGVASLVLAVLALVTLLGVVAWAGANRDIADAPDDSPRIMAVGAVAIAAAAMGLVALALGIAGIAQRDRAKGVAIAGLVIGLLAVAFIALIIVVGAAAEP